MCYKSSNEIIVAKAVDGIGEIVVVVNAVVAVIVCEKLQIATSVFL